jgi:hypothetical protein
MSKEKKDGGVFTYLKGYFEYSPSSKVCLDYAEAVMIDSVYQISIVEVNFFFFPLFILNVFFFKGSSLHSSSTS